MNRRKSKRQSMHVSWKFTNLRGSVWNRLYQNVMKITSKRKETSKGHHNLAHKPTPMPQAMEIPDAKAAVDKEWKKLQSSSPAWQVDKMRSKKEVILEAQEEKNSPLCSVDGHLSSKKTKLEQKYPKYEGQVVLQNNFVKNDSHDFVLFSQSKVPLHHK